MNRYLTKFGLTENFDREAALYSGLFLARIAEQHRDLYKVIGEQGELNASISGKFLYNAENQLNYPVVGDWVMIDRMDGAAGNAIIHHVLPRKSLLARQAAGTAKVEQAIAANIDTIFICMSLNSDFNLRRIERYLTIAWDSMAAPVIVLTKADLCENLQQKMNELSSVSMGVDIVACSSENESGYQAMNDHIGQGKTVAFVGSSGVGKSTIINRLMGREVLATQGIRENDDKGRHTTTSRQLLLLPNGGIVIDTPGMRELQISTGNLSKSFEDIEEIAAGCKYRDCSHGAEPGCMVRKAIEDGLLSEERLKSYQKLQRELSYAGLNSRQLENEKIDRMFGSKAEMKQMLKQAKEKNAR